MTVWTYWAEVNDGIHDVLTSQVGERTEVMDVDEAFNLRPVDQSKAKSANAAARSKMLDACPTRGRVAFVGVYGHACHCTFSIFRTSVNLIRVAELAGIKRPKPVPLALHHGAGRRLLRLKRGANSMLPLGPFGAFNTSLDAQYGVIAKIGKAVFDRSVNVVQMMLTGRHEVELRCHEFPVQLGELGRNHGFLSAERQSSAAGPAAKPEDREQP